MNHNSHLVLACKEQVPDSCLYRWQLRVLVDPVGPQNPGPLCQRMTGLTLHGTDCLAHISFQRPSRQATPAQDNHHHADFFFSDEYYVVGAV